MYTNVVVSMITLMWGHLCVHHVVLPMMTLMWGHLCVHHACTHKPFLEKSNWMFFQTPCEACKHLSFHLINFGLSSFCASWDFTRGQYSHSQGQYSHTQGQYSHSQGQYSHSQRQYSHSQGQDNAEPKMSALSTWELCMLLMSALSTWELCMLLMSALSTWEPRMLLQLHSVVYSPNFSFSF